MSVFLLWFNEWEANYVLGVFETREHAERWKSYFISNPISDGWVAPDMAHLAKKDTDDGWVTRFVIQEYEVGQLNPDVKIDNLKYVEHLFTESEKNAPQTDGTEPTQG